MLHPSIDELMRTIDSKYTLVTISAQRAREFQEMEEVTPNVEKSTSNKYVGMALEEIQAGTLTYQHSK
ncbi:DNA-directed RNA polymerase subunit omega [Salsuginibacillus halophilus]|uniref:DNA-directed RNA polymerase subunit omega n=1 Tax=Salsuginibacillus halophilus TaxID=517424 RepID=A0A2P8HY68_9BACI|nr:DNA-directed RNA polymerase subunit omega [Salsuginibacillus halophilus]PSL51137.1 DNA-directed RNA polymerase subunit omega [Salsuginibacillus halophilus]